MRPRGTASRAHQRASQTPSALAGRGLNLTLRGFSLARAEWYQGPLRGPLSLAPMEDPPGLIADSLSGLHVDGRLPRGAHTWRALLPAPPPGCAGQARLVPAGPPGCCPSGLGATVGTTGAGPPVAYTGAVTARAPNHCRGGPSFCYAASLHRSARLAWSVGGRFLRAPWPRGHRARVVYPRFGIVLYSPRLISLSLGASTPASSIRSTMAPAITARLWWIGVRKLAGRCSRNSTRL